MRKSPILLYLIMTLGFVVGFLYDSQTDPTANVEPILPKYQLASLRGLDTLNIDYSILNQPQFQALKVFGQIPVQPGAGGKTDPFQ